MIQYHSKGDGILCEDGDCVSHAGGLHTEQCIIRDSEGIAVDHDDTQCECNKQPYQKDTH